jgi:hypothetical protein
MPPPPPPPTSSQANSKRRLTAAEETSLVKLAIQHAPMRSLEGHDAFYKEVGLAFQRLQHWQFKTVLRKLQTLEKDYREILDIDGSGTGQELDTERKLAMTRWLEIRDDEYKGKLARRVATNAAQRERVAATSWRDTLVQRVRDRPLVVTTDLPPEDEYYDYSSTGEGGEDVAMSGALPAATATVDDPIAIDEDDEVSDLFPVTPMPSSRRGRGRRGNGTRRGTRSSGSSVLVVIRAGRRPLAMLC